MTESRAEVWFCRLPDNDAVAGDEVSASTRTLVDVEFAADVATRDRTQHLAAVNDCIKGDRIRVRERSASDRTAT